MGSSQLTINNYQLPTESNRIEYKQELTDDLEKEVVAFLNYRDGGVVYIGIDKTGAAVGVPECDEVQLKIKNRLRDKVSPSTMGLFDVVLEQVDGKEVIKITVASGLEKPYHLKRKGMTEQGCFIRVGSASEPMPQRIIMRLICCPISMAYP
jgi:predicted HTH transcriptional regulator